MSANSKKRKIEQEQITDSDSEGSFTTELISNNSDDDDDSNDESIDDWLVGENEPEIETEQREENNLPLDNEDDSEDETDVPLSVRWSNFEKDLTWSANTTFTPTVHPFTDINVGIQTDSGVTIRSTPSEIFKTLVTEDILETISMQTNAFADKKICDLRQSGKLKSRSRVLSYTETSSDEIYAFHALVILMGIVKKPSVDMYWTKNEMLETPYFKKVMTYDRFRQLLSLFCGK